MGLFAQSEDVSLFTESEMVLKTSTCDIVGTLVESKKFPQTPMVLIIAGSGPTDRNGNSSVGVNGNTYKMIAEYLAINGISSLRYDKRLVAASKGALINEKDLRFEDYIEDAIGWIELFKKDLRFSRVIVLGHSEGSLIGMIAAKRTNSAAFVSIAGCGKSGDKILAEQLRNKLSTQLIQESNSILDSLREGKVVNKVNPLLNIVFRTSVQPYMISWIKYNPCHEIQQLNVPVLILQGNTDLQVSVEDAKLLFSAKPDSKLVIIDKMNHVLKESEKDIKTNKATYSNPNLQVKIELLENLVSFILLSK